MMMSRPRFFNNLIIYCFAASFAYWVYLFFASHMAISCDAIGYEKLGRLLYQEGWGAYFITGPNREPVYPWLVSVAMRIADGTGISYMYVQKSFQILILAISQFLLYRFLVLLNIRRGIIVGAILYFGFSPSLVNAGFSLYSEIAAYPFILGIIGSTYFLWKRTQEKKLWSVLGWAICLEFCFIGGTFVKGVLEIGFPLYFLFLIIVFIRWRKKERASWQYALPLVLTAVIFYGILGGYKGLNYRHNQCFTLTDRGAWALYGNTIRRMEPLTFKSFLSNLASVPGEGACRAFFSEEECYFWSAQKSDGIGMPRLGELVAQGIPVNEINHVLVRDSAKAALRNPFQYALLSATEAVKMLFWESTRIGFVDYPAWLERLFTLGIVKNGIRFVISGLTILAFFYLWARKEGGILLAIKWFLTIYIILHSFFLIVTRWALPVAPLYIIIIAYFLDQISGRLYAVKEKGGKQENL
ncbi:MAG TPA: hypothetical protein PL155_05405 [Candidatus Omnitrophota bacterium]|nr:hypothetical protein [Candidatus Omnitrophota bacterium]HPD84082.1 hypothetical protein [Candidatus Omnitrophota bacterium]HRZ02939.1 hypothetical protein [Candidatus Omnitrophota bacterium]